MCAGNFDLDELCQEVLADAATTGGDLLGSTITYDVVSNPSTQMAADGEENFDDSNLLQTLTSLFDGQDSGPLPAAAAQGTHNREILSEAGLEATQINALYERGILREL